MHIYIHIHIVKEIIYTTLHGLYIIYIYNIFHGIYFAK